MGFVGRCMRRINDLIRLFPPLYGRGRSEALPAPQRVQVKLLAPHQLAWLRRPELDEENLEVWELPDGKFYANPKGRPLWVATLVKPKGNKALPPAKAE
jgi:hypothetical protein